MTKIIQTFLMFFMLTSVVFGSDKVAMEKKVVKSDWDAHKELIVTASLETGTDPLAAVAITYLETRFQPKLRNKEGSSASGLFQIVGGTWRSMVRTHGSKHNITAATNVYDPWANAVMGLELMNVNTEYLERRLKRRITIGEQYMAHFLGMGGASKMIRARGDLLARDVLPTAAANNYNRFYRNGKPLTVAQFKANINRDINVVIKHYGNETQYIALRVQTKDNVILQLAGKFNVYYTNRFV